MSLKSEMDDPMEKIVFIELYLDKQKFFGNVAEFLDGLLEGWVEWWNGKVLDRTETDLLSFSPTYLGETIEGYFTSRGLDIPPNDFKKILKDIGYYNFIRLRLTLVFNTINDKFIFKSPNHSEEVDWNRFKEVWSKPRNSLSYSNRRGRRIF